MKKEEITEKWKRIDPEDDRELLTDIIGTELEEFVKKLKFRETKKDADGNTTSFTSLKIFDKYQLLFVLTSPARPAKYQLKVDYVNHKIELEEFTGEDTEFLILIRKNRF